MPDPTISQLIDRAAARLSWSPNPRLDAETLFLAVSGTNRAALLAKGDEAVAAETAGRFAAVLARRENHEPIQYILGVAAFWRDEFLVSPAVLIPRPDTETLIEAVAERLREHPSPTILDIGTGSGCIALSLLRELKVARAIAVDVSEASLSVAADNAKLLGLAGRIRFVRSRWFESVDSEEGFDAVVSNPPYVSPSDMDALPREVREFEPSLALFSEDADELSSYRSILHGASRRLTPHGLLAVEVGIGQADRVAALFEQAGLDGVQAVSDLAGIPRVVLGHGR